MLTRVDSNSWCTALWPADTDINYLTHRTSCPRRNILSTRVCWGQKTWLKGSSVGVCDFRRLLLPRGLYSPSELHCRPQDIVSYNIYINITWHVRFYGILYSSWWPVEPETHHKVQETLPKPQALIDNPHSLCMSGTLPDLQRTLSRTPASATRSLVPWLQWRMTGRRGQAGPFHTSSSCRPLQVFRR